MASTTDQTDGLTGQAVQYYSHSLWRDFVFASAFVVLIIDAGIVALLVYKHSNSLGFMNSFSLVLAPVMLALFAFMLLRAHDAIRRSLGLPGTDAFRDMTPLQRAVVQSDMQVSRFALLFAVVAFNGVLHLLFKPI